MLTFLLIMPYSCCLMLLFFFWVNSDFFSCFHFHLKIHYRNDTTRPPYLLTQTSCGFPCKLQTFMEISQPLIPTDWVKECQTEDSRPGNFFTLKMHEHDYNEDEPLTGMGPEDVRNLVGSTSETGSFNWDPIQNLDVCSPSAFRK